MWFFFSSRFQSERESGDRNFAIGYYLKEKKVSEFCFFFRLTNFKRNIHIIKSKNNTEMFLRVSHTGKLKLKALLIDNRIDYITVTIWSRDYLLQTKAI